MNQWNRNLNQKAFFNGGISLIEVISLLGINISLARILPKSEYGLFQQILLIYGFFGVVFINGFQTAFFNFWGKVCTYKKQIGLLKSILMLFFLSGIPAGFLIWLAGKWIVNPYFLKIQAVLFALLFFTGLNNLIKSLFQISHQLKRYFFRVLFFRGLITGVVIYGIFFWNFRVSEVFLGMLIREIFLFSGSGVLRLRKWKILCLYSLKKSESSLKEILRYLLVISSIGYMGYFNEKIDKWMVSILLSPEKYAEFQVGSFQIPFISIITLALTNSVLPVFSRLYQENNIQEIACIWRKIIVKASFFLLPIFVFSLINAHSIITFFYTEKYRISGGIFQIYLLKYFFTVVTFGAVMCVLGLEKWVLMNNGIILVLNSLMVYAGIRLDGYRGAAIASTFVWYLGAILQVFQIKMKLKLNFSDYFDLREYIEIIAISTFLGYICYRISPNPIRWNLIWTSLIYYGVTLLMLKLIKGKIFTDDALGTNRTGS